MQLIRICIQEPGRHDDVVGQIAEVSVDSFIYERNFLGVGRWSDCPGTKKTGAAAPVFLADTWC
ncbi:hypothetical protein [Bordetella pseudohinzii]|uniref:hypothetical protein n=1 Tax=Bordetella pseudohinzii TaxID=1331258 RepID=UPI00045A3D82|nr:hypothetical protein [Bordetella pseudohinzii]